MKAGFHLIAEATLLLGSMLAAAGSYATSRPGRAAFGVDRERMPILVAPSGCGNQCGGQAARSLSEPLRSDQRELTTA
jgi:hypothetical protein